jgi:thioredoxin-related protein
MDFARYRKTCLLMAVVAATLSPFKTTLAEPPPGYHFVRYDEGMRQAQADNRPVFVYFGRYGCGYCDKTNKVGFADPAVKTAYTQHYVLVYVNSESMDRLTLASGERITEMQLGERLNTLGTPVFFFLQPDGRQIHRAYGYQDPARLLEMDRLVQNGEYANAGDVAFQPAR